MKRTSTTVWLLFAGTLLVACTRGDATGADDRAQAPLDDDVSDGATPTSSDDDDDDVSDGATPTSSDDVSDGATPTSNDDDVNDDGATPSAEPAETAVPTPSPDDPVAAPQGPDLGPFPTDPSPVSRGGTMTFLNIGAPGAWPRRLDREAGDPACDYKDGEDTWGGHCCQTLHETESDDLAPFDEEMTFIAKAISIQQLAVYQPTSDVAGARWARVTSFDERSGAENLWFTQEGDGSTTFPGDLTQNDCIGYVMQEPLIDCADASDYYCPNDDGVLHRGYSGSKLIVFLGSMDLVDSELAACGGAESGHPGPWVALVASELVRDGGRKWNGLCNCYSQTGTVGDGCGEINVFEVVLDNNEFSNREFASTGVRSYQAGHIGGAVCTSDCERDAFQPSNVDVVDACAGTAYETGPEIVAMGDTNGCPVWRRPQGHRYFFILLDETTRTIQVGMVHPDAIPDAASGLLPALPFSVERDTVDRLIEMRLP